MSKPQKLTQEEIRLQEDRARKAYWRRWGCYLSNRQWGTVREDYSKDGSAWDYFSFEQSHYRAYRWGEDGIAGISDNHQRLCFSLALWNEHDPFLKERLYGLTNSQGNHGEDVKEYYFHLDNTPTHSYMKFLYKYPQQAFPYEQLEQENKERGLENREFELIQTGIFDNDEYFDVTVEYAKETDENILIFIQVTNRGDEKKTIHLLPTLLFRNIWSWGYDVEKPQLKIYEQSENYSVIEAQHPDLGKRWLYCTNNVPSPGRRGLGRGQTPLLFTENDTNYQKLSRKQNDSPYVKDAFHQYIVEEKQDAVNPDNIGTKFAAHYILELAPGESTAIQRFDYYYNGDFKVECPTGSGNMMNLWEVASELERRLISIFLPKENGERPLYGDFTKFQTDENWQDLLLFSEYFHGDNGAGLGASHQTGWTGLVAKLIMQRSEQ